MAKFIHIHTFIVHLDQDGAIFKLLREIEEVTKFPLRPYLNGKHMVIHYLKDYRARRPIGKDCIDAVPFSASLLLKQKIKKLHNTDIYWLCHEIARIKRTGVEQIAGKTLYVFLDQFLKDEKRKKKSIKSPLPAYLIP
ncbi:MAG: hypothetical protein A2W22_06920 [Candidatus Levybacteria bacterium RBG_16_35_11]|nr:MAG: hypothetical protein A2W22_06920 [Candidatus Levybacteria bacterium RBG_16_35_11]